MGIMKDHQLYLKRIPGGLDGYPECKTKASILQLLSGFFGNEWARALDEAPELHFLKDLPPQNAWIPEVHANAILLSLFEASGWTEAQIEFMGHQGSVAMNENPLYSFLLRMLTSNMILNGAASRWGRLHSGSELTSRREGTAIMLMLRFPEHLMPQILGPFYTGVFQAVLDEARDKGIVTLQSAHDDRFIWRVGPRT